MMVRVEEGRQTCDGAGGPWQGPVSDRVYEAEERVMFKAYAQVWFDLVVP